MGCCPSTHESAMPDPGAVKMEPHAAAPTVSEIEQIAAAMMAFDFHGFLSHDWGTDALGRSNHRRVVAIKRRLAEECGLQCWLDEEKMKGNINLAMANGIDSSATVVVFITQTYVMKVAGKGPNGLDDNCKKEFPPRVERGPPYNATVCHGAEKPSVLGCSTLSGEERSA